MNAQSFLANFGHIADAPSGIKRLREMIYQLGIIGALCRQDASEGTGKLLLENIEEEKQARTGQGLFKRSSKFENLKDAYIEALPDIPKTWAWTQLVEVGEINPKNVAEDDMLASFSSMSTISEMHGVPPRPEDRLWATIKKGFTHFADGDVVVAKITPCFENGKAAVLSNLTSGIGAGTTELHVVRLLPGVEPAFIYIFLRSPHFKTIGESHMTGTAGQKRLPTEYFAARPLPLPPLAEQKRIVTKVDELMALCDKLEAQQQEGNRRFPVLSHASHARFVESPSLANLKAIFDEADTVSPEDLRKTILTLAALGKLVPQNDFNSTGKCLIEKIHAKRTKLLNLGKIPRRKPCRSWSHDEVPFKAPNSWAWTMLGEITDIGTGSTPSKDNSHFWLNGTIPWVASGSTSNPRISVGDELVTEEAVIACRLRIYNPGTLLVALYGQGKTRGQVSTLEIKATINQALAAICPIEGYEEMQDFLKLLLQKNYDEIRSQSAGGAQPNLNVQKIKEMFIPVPPIAEQRRIVAKVDQLMAIVDQMEKLQNKKDRIAEAFSQAAVATITGTQIKEQEKMKAPKTELVTKLQVRTKPKTTDKAPLAILIAKFKGELSAKHLWQQSGLEIDAFYQQLKTEMANGWIVEPEKAVMKEVDDN